MHYEDSVASVEIYAATCGAGPAEEERQKALKAKQLADAARNAAPVRTDPTSRTQE